MGIPLPAWGPLAKTASGCRPQFLSLQPQQNAKQTSVDKVVLGGAECWYQVAPLAFWEEEKSMAASIVNIKPVVEQTSF